MAKMLSTDLVPQKQKLEFWNEAVSETFVSLQCVALGDRDFIDGEISVKPLASLEVSMVRGTGQLVSRASSGIAEDQDGDFYLVGVQTRGSCVVSQDGKDARIDHGGFALYDPRRPYSLELTDDFEQLVIRVPRVSLDRQFAGAEQLSARGVDASRGAGILLSNSIKTFAHEIGTLSPEAAYAVSQGIEHLIVAGLESVADVDADDALAGRRQVIQRYILKNLCDPQLSITSVSEALHLSPSSVHRTFAAEGETVMNWVWQQRLDGVYRDLTGSRHRGTLTELAHSWGFSDSAHFSRAFRRRFSVTPSQLRAKKS
ncbi:AraC family transcriptional regulator [Arthrobacter sp. MYb227]|uniref:AraC-like ligand-binding domain-containing protein n=1 Tax=Arthrobacter sp. MYb227 TaxID=1848601 RepID=UPI000CFC851C|nr:helix-turn-helix domain-containing protein [Arthrobacter sp. MYb227]PQZ92898.1 AraC family transcriptional regulator [Arthrobacter sp. MYb227]